MASPTPVHRRPLPESWQRTDWIIAVVLAVAAVEMTYLSHFTGLVDPHHGVHLSAAGSAAAALVLAARRRRPVVTAVITTGMHMLLAELLGMEPYASQVVLFLAFYSIGAWCADRRLAHRSRVLIVAAMGIWFAVGMVRGFYDPATGERGVNAYFAMLGILLMTNLAYFAAAWVFGNRSWVQALEQHALAEAHGEIREQQDRLQEQAVRLERLRIARELHDVVAHHVTAMGVQAGAARMLLDRAPERAAAHLREVEDSSRGAVKELQSMVHTLRDDDADGTSSLPRLGDLEALVAEGDGLGTQRVVLERIGTPAALPPAAELALYRAAQEGLTNARKHAGPRATVTVRLRAGADATEVEVSDDGRGGSEAGPRGAARADGTRMGLLGMRERVESVGGTVSAGPKPGGGWLVRARVPSPLTARPDDEGAS